MIKEITMTLWAKSPLSEANSRLFAQELRRLLWNLTVYCSPLLVHDLPPTFCDIRFNVILPSVTRFCKRFCRFTFFYSNAVAFMIFVPHQMTCT